MPKTFEFVPEYEYRPVMAAVCSAVEKVKKIIWEEERISFDWEFVGSANRQGMALITREIGGNRGYDFDVNFFLKHPADRFWKADYCRNIFLQALDRVFHTDLHSIRKSKGKEYTLRETILSCRIY